MAAGREEGMKELLYGWIRDIAFYTLLMEVVLHVLPEQGQRKVKRSERK